MKHIPHLPLYTDYYQLTMASGYWQTGKADDPAVFNYYFRDQPFGGGYVVFAGLEEFMWVVRHFRFDDDALAWLKSQNFNPGFLSYLKNLKLSVTIESVREGSIVFPDEPLVTVSGPLLQCQLLETVLLNQINFQSLIATKAARVKYAAGDKKVMDFGLRRAQGLGGLQASRAAYIGGIDATSNVWSAREYQVPPSGTVAHSWVQSFDTELEAFRSYAECNPDATTLLVDTYDTLKSGIPNAITVARELEEKGHRLVAVRLDSGDPVSLSRKVRSLLDEAGLDYVKIALSDQLDEYTIQELLEAGAPIDFFGVGTRLVTGHDTPALDGVYKISEISGKPTAKRTDNPKKQSLPGHKSIIRLYDDRQMFAGDLVCLKSEVDDLKQNRASLNDLNSGLTDQFTWKEILHVVADHSGVSLKEMDDLNLYRQRAHKELQFLPEEFKRFKKPERYPVWVSNGVEKLKVETQKKVQL